MKHLIIFLIILTSTVFTQRLGSISGVVTDNETKQPLPGVNIIVSGTKLGAVSKDDGSYTINNMEEGIYVIEYSFIGYSTHLENDVRVIRQKTTQVRMVELNQKSIMNREVTVRAGYFEDDINKTINTFGYNRDEILRTPGAGGDIFRAIETLPGVSSAGGEFTAFSVRGGSPKDNIILIDNIPFDRIAHFDRGNEDQEVQGGRFSIFTPGVIDAATFQAGGFSAKYGGKNSSIVSLKIKEGNPRDFTINGTYDVLGWEVNYDGPSFIDKNTSILFSARAQDFKNILNWTGQKDLGDPSFMDILLKTTTNINVNHKLSFVAIYSPELFDRNINHVYESLNAFDTDIIRQSETKRVLGVNWRALLGSNSWLMTTAYYKNKDIAITLGEVRNDPVNGIRPSKENARVIQDKLRNSGFEEETGVKIELNSRLSAGNSVSIGAELNRFSAKYDLVLSAKDTIYTYDRNDFRQEPSAKFIARTPQMVNNYFDATEYNANGYVEYTGDITENVTVNAGGRYEYTGFSRSSTFSPRFSVAWFPLADIKLNFASGIYYQAPDMQLITEFNDNRSLGNEKSVHFIGGITSYLSDDYKLTVESYYKDFSDLIVRPDRISLKRINGGKGWAAGIDISIVKRLSDKWYGQVNYSYSQSERNEDLGEGWYRSDFNQPNIFNILLGYQFDEEWAVSAKWKYATGRPKDEFRVNPDIFNNPDFVRFSKEITGNNTLRFDDYHTLNLRVDYRKQLGKIGLVMFLDVANVYSRLNVNEERFIYRDGTIAKKGFEILPTFGLKIEI